MRQRWITLTENGWHDVVTGYIREGQLEQALEGLDEMRQTGAHIQGWLYDMISYALCDIEELDEALRIMQDRVSSGDINISPSSWYYLFDVGCKLLHVSSSGLYVSHWLIICSTPASSLYGKRVSHSNI